MKDWCQLSCKNGGDCIGGNFVIVWNWSQSWHVRLTQILLHPLYLPYFPVMVCSSKDNNTHRRQVTWNWLQELPVLHWLMHSPELKPHWACRRYVADLYKFPQLTHLTNTTWLWTALYLYPCNNECLIDSMPHHIATDCPAEERRYMLLGNHFGSSIYYF